MSCDCDYEIAEAYSSKIIRARKTYQCYECKGLIRIDERYERVFGVMSRGEYPFIIKTCLICVNLRRWLTNSIPCICWEHGSFDVNVSEAIHSAQYRAPDETKGLYFSFLRRKYLRETKNQFAINVTTTIGK